jgi:hypothetical protein
VLYSIWAYVHRENVGFAIEGHDAPSFALVAIDSCVLLSGHGGSPK